jgi:hypothetical protein
MSFLKLVNDEDRTAISDHSHDLVVYKLDKKFDFDKDLSYLQLPHFKSKLQTKLSTIIGNLQLTSQKITYFYRYFFALFNFLILLCLSNINRLYFH